MKFGIKLANGEWVKDMMEFTEENESRPKLFFTKEEAAAYLERFPNWKGSVELYAK